MAYADLLTIQTLNTGDILTAACMTQVRLNDEFLVDPPACSCSASAGLSVATDTPSTMAGNVEAFDNDSMHSTSTNNSRITIQTPGRYYLTATCTFSTGAGSERNVYFLIDGTTSLPGTKVNANTSGSQNTIITTSRAYDFNAGQYVETRVQQRSGSTLTVVLDEFFAYFITR